MCGCVVGVCVCVCVRERREGGQAMRPRDGSFSGMEREQVQGLGDGWGGNSVIREQLEEPSELQWTGLGMGHCG